MTERPKEKKCLEYRGPIRKSLPDDPDILEQYDVLRAISFQKDEQKRLLIETIKAFQGKCLHDEGWQEVRGLITGTLRGWRCVTCKVFKPMPDGYPWEVCTECGTEMVFSHIFDEQKVHVYRCPNCSHEEEVT